MALTGMPDGGFSPYANLEGITNLILPPSFIKGTPIFHPSITLFKPKVIGEPVAA